MSFKYPFEESLNSEIELKVAMGKVPGYETIHKFGSSEDINTVLKDIWSVSGNKNYLSVGAPLFIWSLDNADTTDITIFGVDENWEKQQATITLTGVTPVAIPGNWLRVFRATNSGTSLLVGETYIAHNTANAPLAPLLADTEAHVTVETQQTLMTQFTVPKGFTGFIKNFYINTTKGKDVKGYGFFRVPGGVFRGAEILTTYENPVVKELPYLPFPEMTDFVIKAKSDVTNTFVSASFDIILVKTDPNIEKA